MPIQIKNGEFKGGLVEGLMLLSKGDSAVFLISADSIFKNQPTLPPGVFKGKDLKFTVKVVSLLGKAEIAKERSKMEKEFSNRKQEMEGQLGKDTLVIIEHLKTNKIKYKKNQGGVYYSITKAGSGKKLAMNDSIKEIGRAHV